MQLRTGGAVLATALAALGVSAPMASAAREPLNAYRVAPTQENKQRLAKAGYDMVEADHGSYLEIYGTAKQAAALTKQGLAPALQGKANTVTSQSADVPVGSDAQYNVWRRYDRVAGDNKEQYLELYDRLEGMSIVKKVILGKTRMNRDIVALKVTSGAKTRTDNTRPAVLYNAMQHAREWLAGETCKRTLNYFTTNYGKATPDGAIATELVNTRELWFVCVNNPDGYEYTFTPGNRLWRKNMNDNNANGVLGEAVDGVDINRNHATHWGYDNEGSSEDFLSETYRGAGPDSEPETKAIKKLWGMVDFVFNKNDHTAAELLLWPNGFQQYTPTPDDKLFEAYAGTDASPAIADGHYDADGEWEITGHRFDPDIGAELYITNGDLTDDAYANGILAYTPEGSEPDIPNVSGFEFQDVEADIQAEFLRHKEFVLDLARSADDPANPISHLGNTVENFYVETFADSYGDPQPVQVVAKKSLGEVKLRYRINDGPVRTVATAGFTGGERFDQEPGLYYHRLRGTVTGTSPGDEVEVWFEGGRKSSPHFTYTARAESGAKVLILSAENYTAGVPAYPDTTGPSYLTYYTDALEANGVAYDIYDVDKRGNRSPDWLGVLGHYDAVLWYMGDDYLTRRPGQPAGTGTARLAVEEMIDVRHFLNEGGKLFFTGKSAGQQWAEGNVFRNFGFPEPPEGGRWCDNALPEFDPDDPAAADGCIAHNDDFLQYYLGAYIYATPGNTFDDEAGRPYGLRGSGPYNGMSWLFDETGANNQDHSATFVVTSSVLPPAQFPMFASSRSVADWLRPGAAPFSPYSGTMYMSAGADSQAYKRLGKTLDLTGRAAPKLSFKFSGDVEANWDWVTVEARDVTTDPNSDAWTTLPEADTDGAGDADVSLTTQETGDSCAEGLATDSDAPHPFLLHYWSPTCEPTGTTGVWNAFTGSSGGWTDWTVDLSAYAGKKVDLRISVITDWGTLGLGVWVDDLKLTDGATVLESNDFETGTGGWVAGPPPAGTDVPVNGWERRTEEFKEGGVVTTDDTVYTGFGFEGINESARVEFMKRTLTHLGVLGGGSVSVPVVVEGEVEPTPTPAPPVTAPSPVAPSGGVLGQSKTLRASAKLKSAKTLRVRGGRTVSVRVNCTGDAGAVCRGTVQLVRGKTKLATKKYAVRAGKTATVKLRVKGAKTVKATVKLK
ncbi:M14 family zinc carboxypeptidase [Solirubrobacter soli]|uniref:M14 family zinc carboxypeptidase n=1 Tax=Solirubrobacter soli TaxID=363832 RepID=UPI000422D34B|nr:M14 family zinc carboxypeptidase [Solirubrobacter soli]